MTDERASWAARRGRPTVVVSILVGGATALIASTQVWARTDVAGVALDAAGSDVLALLQPLALATLALSFALALTGSVARLVLSLLAAILGAALVWICTPVAVAPGVATVESVVTDHTGIAGHDAVADLVSGVETTVWPWIAAVSGLIVLVSGIVGAVTGHAWRRRSHRYDAAAGTHSGARSGPLDAVDSWDDLSRGGDPTSADGERRGLSG
ncbi:hypothetical protein GCM10010915_18800 [Microbacterium faecale]|uniref:Peptidase n=1 Tax=Microbacterium faecale TaxID=1804630 RepID=A0A916YBL2_9MICO|nr:Trp biosynthesis-associated membrane protein [Microbacterium faecale]GGD38232.1 hypothetical protein GCM10010915_18800 [Microbacterium faecale]